MEKRKSRVDSTLSPERESLGDKERHDILDRPATSHPLQTISTRHVRYQEDHTAYPVASLKHTELIKTSPSVYTYPFINIRYTSNRELSTRTILQAARKMCFYRRLCFYFEGCNGQPCHEGFSSYFLCCLKKPPHGSFCTDLAVQCGRKCGVFYQKDQTFMVQEELRGSCPCDPESFRGGEVLDKWFTQLEQRGNECEKLRSALGDSNKTKEEIEDILTSVEEGQYLSDKEKMHRDEMEAKEAQSSCVIL